MNAPVTAGMKFSHTVSIYTFVQSVDYRFKLYYVSFLWKRFSNSSWVGVISPDTSHRRLCPEMKSWPRALCLMFIEAYHTFVSDIGECRRTNDAEI